MNPLRAGLCLLASRSRIPDAAAAMEPMPVVMVPTY